MNNPTIPLFTKYIGIDYSGAATSTDRLKGLQVYVASPEGVPEKQPAVPDAPSWNWTRCGIAEWLHKVLSEDRPKLVGIDHGFSFPLQYFEKYNLKYEWPAFLDDFQNHWPADEDENTVEDIRGDHVGNGAARTGDPHWRRLTELRAGGAKSVFHFDVPGSVAKSTHAGIPWLRFLRKELGEQVHFWPFDGWEIPTGRSVISEVYPRLWNKNYPMDGRTQDQHDAYSVARWMQDADQCGGLPTYLNPALSVDEMKQAEIEGWILGL